MNDNRADMELYKKMYYMLFNAVTDSLELISSDQSDAAVARLRKAQQLAEDLFISSNP